MPEIPKDAAIGADKDVRINNGDIVLTRNEDTIEQSIAIAVGEAITERIGGPFTAERAADIRLAINEALDSDPLLRGVDSISIERVSTDEAITFNARTSFNDDEFTFEVTE